MRAGLRYAAYQSRYTVTHRIEDRLPAVGCPTLVVRGAKDPVVPRGWAEEVVRLLPDARLRTIPGAAHAVVCTDALELARLTEAFLASSPVPE